MAEPTPRAARISRESRLLLLTVALCAVVLLVLARWRFPDREDVPTAAPPLERLAARASYEALAADIQRVEATIASHLIVLRLAPEFPVPSRRLADLLAHEPSSAAVRHVAALRIGPESALAAIEPGVRIDGIVAGAVDEGQASVIAFDPIRRLARLRVPQAVMRQLQVLPLTSLATPAYVVAVEGTQAGASLRPVFLGRGDRFASARWSQPLLPLGGVSVAPGALLFSLTGEFIGTVVLDNGSPAIAGARAVLDDIDRLATATPSAATLGIAVQPLSGPLAVALGTKSGVVVSDVDPKGPAAERLQAADVIVGIDDWSTDNPDELLLRVAARAPGDIVTIHAVRNGKPIDVALTLSTLSADADAAATFTFAAERDVGARVTAAPRGSGLRIGDIVTRAGTVDRPTPAEMRQVLSRPTPTGFVVLVIRRDTSQQIVPVALPPSADAAR